MASSGAIALVPLRLDGEVDEEDGVLLHDPDEEEQADDGDDAEVHPEDHQRHERADAGRRQRRQDRDRVDVALVEHAEHDVDGEERRGDEQRLVLERRREGLRRPLEVGVDARRQVDAELRLVDRVDRLRRATRCGARLNEMVTAGNCPWWLTESAVVAAASTLAMARSGTAGAGGALHVDAVERVRRVAVRLSPPRAPRGTR